MTEDTTLIHKWPPCGPSYRCYFGVLAASLIIRFVLAFFKAVDQSPLSRRRAAPFWTRIWRGIVSSDTNSDLRFYFGRFFSALHGFSSDEGDRDCGLPFLLGCIEVFCFSFLIAAEAWTFIGAWLGFKVLAQWGHWGTNRRVFNRFLLGTAMTLMASAYLAAQYFGYNISK